jgi:hypothetical protein
MYACMEVLKGTSVRPKRATSWPVSERGTVVCVGKNSPGISYVLLRDVPATGTAYHFRYNSLCGSLRSPLPAQIDAGNLGSILFSWFTMLRRTVPMQHQVRISSECRFWISAPVFHASIQFLCFSASYVCIVCTVQHGVRYCSREPAEERFRDCPGLSGRTSYIDFVSFVSFGTNLRSINNTVQYTHTW